MKALNKTKGSSLAERLVIASSLAARIKGLLGRGSLPSGEGMLIERCSQIHTFFMRFSIDVLFLDKGKRIVHLIRELAPNRLTAIHFASKSVLELPAGTIDKTGTQVGDAVMILN